ncbi:hypothetical protein ECTOBSL9_0570 [Ectothiorhodospira sp. BSL-9]|nr:hypothetical protein ECTOBSL9_0570 [Ectothiorhodospira sp. BSL-9]
MIPEPNAERTPTFTEIHIGHATEQRRLGAQRLGFEAGLPEVPGTAILPVGLSSDGLVQALHEPAQVRQPPPVALGKFRHLGQLKAFLRRSGQVPLDQQGPLEQAAPAPQHLVIGPPLGVRRLQLDHQVIMIGHDCVGGDVHGEQGGQQPDTVLDPLPAVFKALAGGMILATQEGTPHTARDDVVVRGVGHRYLLATGAWHVSLLDDGSPARSMGRGTTAYREVRGQAKAGNRHCVCRR